MRRFGDARLDPARVPARDDTLWLLYSNTKVITACAVWLLVERGALRFTDRVAEHVPGFEANGKGDITIIQLLSHQGGFPNAEVPKAAWEDHELLRRTVCGFTLEWTPGSRVHYHGRAAHWVAAVLIEALTKTDYRAFIRENIAEPLGLGRRAVRRPARRGHARAVDMHEPSPDGGQPVKRGRGEQRRVPARRHAGRRRLRDRARDGGVLPDAGCRAARSTARGSSRRAWSQYVTRNYTGDRVDAYMGMPMHRGLGPHVRGTTATIRGLGSHRLAAHLRPRRRRLVVLLGRSRTPGVSFAYLTNGRVPDPWHSARLDRVSNLVHAAIV